VEQALSDLKVAWQASLLTEEKFKTILQGLYTMKQQFDFNELTALCFLTHEQMQQRAAYSVNVALVTRNWLLPYKNKA
jgi:hypothetical protein